MNKSLRVRWSNRTVSCMKLPGLLARETAKSVLSLLTRSQSYDSEPDSVDHMPSFEFYPMAAGRWTDQALQEKLDQFVRTVMLPYVQQTFACPQCSLADILVRRYVASERRTHQLHFDGHAYVTVVLGLTDPSEFEGGLYIQPGAHASSREFVHLDPGDAFVHSFDLQHGVPSCWLAGNEGIRGCVFIPYPQFPHCLVTVRFGFGKGLDTAWSFGLRRRRRLLRTALHRGTTWRPNMVIQMPCFLVIAG